MVYLSDVPSQMYGAFEAVINPRQARLDQYETEIITGPMGTTWWFNRSSPHRATPNSSSRRRRLLKMSFQHASLPNHHVVEPAFRSVLEASQQRGDQFMSCLFGANLGSTDDHMLPAVVAPLPTLIEAAPNSALAVTWNERMRASRARATADRWGLNSTQRLARKVARRVRRQVGARRARP